MAESRSFHFHYERLLREVDAAPVEDNARTGKRIKVLAGGQSFRFRADGVPVPGVRRVYPGSAAVEAAWFLMGTASAEWVNARVPHWRSFTNKHGHVEGAYGWRLRHEFGRDQVAMALDALRMDPSNRQVVLTMWDPRRDGLGQADQPANIPCPTHFSLSVVGGRLHMSLFIRSSDVFVGLPYDAMCFALLLDAFARDLGVGNGTVHVTLAHAHMYESHWGMAVTALSQRDDWADDPPQMPGLTSFDILRNPEAYVALVKETSKAVRWPEFKPVPEIVL